MYIHIYNRFNKESRIFFPANAQILHVFQVRASVVLGKGIYSATMVWKQGRRSVSEREPDFTAIKLYLWKQEVGRGTVPIPTNDPLILTQLSTKRPDTEQPTGTHVHYSIYEVYHSSIKVWGRAPPKPGLRLQRPKRTVWWQPGKNYKIIYTAWCLLSLALGLRYDRQQLGDDEPMRLTEDLRNLVGN